MGRHRASAQRDLFTMGEPAAALPPEVRRRLVPLLEQLLVEVAMADTAAPQGGPNEQDHP